MKEETFEELKSMFAKLDKNKIPPAHIEENLIAELISTGEINKESSWPKFLRLSAAAVALIVLFVAGFYVGKYSVLIGGQSDSTVAYMLLLKEDADFIQGDPDDRFQEYAMWMIGTADKGISINGQELAPEVAQVSSAGSKQVGKAQENRITGYFIVSAQSIEEAEDIANSCPHVKYGGKIDIKRIISN